jgi:pimeloyl-ACP methyl ester carboxylesterase
VRFGVAAIALGVLAGTAAAQERMLPGAPGKLVDIGGRRIHLLCSGTGAPSVILEAGASAFAIDWTLVQREVAKTHRVCSYDRAGMGWSDSVAFAARAPESLDLHNALAAAGERPPYIMVGASRGGLLIRTFLSNYPDEVAGLVFVDPATEDRLFTMIRGEAKLLAEVTPDELRGTFPLQSVRVPRRRPQAGPPFDKLPADLYQLRLTLDERLIAATPDFVTPEFIAAFQEGERSMLAALLRSRASGNPFGNRPTVVLSRGADPNAERDSVHAALARLSTNWRHTVVPRAGHEIHLFEPAAVTQAILDVARSIRETSKLPPR